MRGLEDLRDNIDEIDKKIVRLYEQRILLAAEIAEDKIANNKQVLDREREQEKLKKLEGLIESKDTGNDIHELYQQIMSLSRKRQYQIMQEKGLLEKEDFTTVESLEVEQLRVVYQGVEGAYSQLAMKEYFGHRTDSYSVLTWKDAMEEIKNGRAHYGVLPIENSSAGIVSENYDLLVNYDNYIVGEQTIHIDHALLGLKESSLEDITCVYSHPQALMQCVSFLEEHKQWKQKSLENTAVSAKKILEDGLKNQAAIASHLTADIYGLKILKESINFSQVNSTRFIIISNRKICVKGANKISICFELQHKSGTLYQMLSHFIYNNLNMSKIESRPIKDKRFEYRFFIDFEGSLKDSAVQNALHGLKEEAHQLRILGNY